MPMLRDLGGLEQFPYLARLGLDADDASRLDVLEGASPHGGFAVEARTGEMRLLQAGEALPAGVWIAQRDIDTIHPNPGTAPEPTGFGEGFGAQAEQVGGDRSYQEEDSGGTRRVPHEDDAELIDADGQDFAAEADATPDETVLGRGMHIEEATR